MTSGIYGSIFKRLQSKELILPYFEHAMLADRWPESYSVLIDSSPYYGHNDGYFHPSSHAMMGARELYYRFHPDTRDLVLIEKRMLQSHMTLAIGSALHGVLQTQMQMAGLVKPKNIEWEYVNSEHNVRGRIDWIVDHPTGQEIPVEMKSLACSTPILTSGGWSTMGALEVGDEVYAPDGQLTKVVMAHQINLNRPCYRVNFRDGQSLVADSAHLWQVWDLSLKQNRVLTTTEIMTARRYDRHRFAVPVTQPLQAPEVDLPIDPWLLGMWLGDGSSAHVEITTGERDLDYVTGRLDDLKLGYRINRWQDKAPRVYVHRQRGVFMRQELLGNKHIPDQYMLASESQRRQLLAGLMDSDGTVSDHQAMICGVREPLMRQVLQLVRSLGYRATWSKVREAYYVKFSSTWPISPFDMPRKKAVFDAKGASVQRLNRNSIVSVEPVDTVPVRCITVAHESSLYVVGEGFIPTHNTMNHYKFDKQTEIKPSWDAQLSIGLDNFGADFGILLLVETGYPFHMREFRVPRNDQLLSEIYRKFDYVRECIELNTPPKHCCPYDSLTMKACQARVVCYLAEEIGESQ